MIRTGPAESIHRARRHSEMSRLQPRQAMGVQGQSYVIRVASGQVL
jgi:hypothetical protein